jgi:dihydrofolate synthase/folylpolyglutamate synthase
MTYPEALSYLGEARRFGMKLGLEPMRQVAQALGNPQEKLRFIHLAGTNGKGSTAAFTEACLRAAGFRVGLYTSPHLVSVCERVEIDRVPLSETDFASGMTAVRDALSALENPPTTFFELMTALALRHFAREKVDWVVWETGLGGRLDATNIVRPEVCIITNIGLDHQQYLGQTLGAIAEEKAGIIKPGVPVISAVESGAASAVIARIAQKQGAPLVLVPRDLGFEDLGWIGGKQRAKIGSREYSLRLVGSHQVENAACAVAALRQPPFGEIVSEEAIARGLEGAAWPGRFEIISESPLMVLDGAHNVAGVRRLVQTWRSFLTSRGKPADGRTHLVFAAVSDKDVTEIARLLWPVAGRVSLVRLANERTAEPAALAAHFEGRPCRHFESLEALQDDLRETSDDLPVLFAGSLFLVGEVLARRHAIDAAEFRLNERLEIPAELR